MRGQHDVGAESPESSKNASCSSLPRYSLRLQLRRHEFFLRTQTSTILSQSQVITTLLPAPLYNAQYRNQAWPDLLEPPMGASKTTSALPLRIQGLLTSSGSTKSLASWHDMLSDHMVPSAGGPTGCLLGPASFPWPSTHPHIHIHQNSVLVYWGFPGPPPTPHFPSKPPCHLNCLMNMCYADLNFVNLK